MGRALRIIHLANFNSTNVGNGALASGLEGLLASDLPASIRWLRDAWDDYTFGFRQFDRSFVARVNAGDGLVVNGAVAIHGRAYLKETGMRFELPLALLAEVRRPVIFYGISYRHFKGQEFHHQETLRRTLAAMVELDNVFLGVRNDGTKKWLREALLVPRSVLEKIHEVPDTGVFVEARPGRYPEILRGRKVILFAPNDEDAPFRFGEPNCSHVRETGYRLSEEGQRPDETVWSRNRDRLIQAVARALTAVMDESGAQLLIVPHYLDDLRFAASLVDAFRPQLAHQRTISTGLMRVGGTAYFYGRYVAADLAVSMRVHSMSPCIGLGVPMIPLVTQPRMHDFLERIGLADLGMDAFAEGLEAALAGECRRVLADPDARRDRFARAKAAMREEARSINTRLAAMLLKGGR